MRRLGAFLIAAAFLLGTATANATTGDYPAAGTIIDRYAAPAGSHTVYDICQQTACNLHVVHDPPVWSVRIRNSGSDGWYAVPQPTFDACTPGTEWRVDGCAR